MVSQGIDYPAEPFYAKSIINKWASFRQVREAALKLIIFCRGISG